MFIPTWFIILVILFILMPDLVTDLIGIIFGALILLVPIGTVIFIVNYLFY